MADDLDHLDDLPKRDANHVTEEKAETAFQRLLTASGRFILERADHKDYGTDCEIEVVDQEQATNVSVHVQLKGTERQPRVAAATDRWRKFIFRYRAQKTNVFSSAIF